MKPEFRIYHILRPLGWIYGALTGIRNRLFDMNALKSVSFGIPVISIGNITAGGTGKTPHTEYVASILKDYCRTAVLSRGYGRHTKGFFMSDERSDSGLIGDEPLQIKRRFPDIDVAVCEDRAVGINRVIGLCNPQAVILDDAFQHRKVTPSLNILLVNWHRNILDDAMLPAGHLRESAARRNRAHIIIVTKCPEDLSQEAMESMTAALRTDASQKVFFSTLEYGSIYPMQSGSNAALPSGPALVVTGIASPRQIEEYLTGQGRKVTLMTYPDHYRYSKQDIRKIADRLNAMGSDAFVITTAKDAARLADLNIDAELLDRIFVLPVGVRFLKGGDDFERIIKKHVDSFGK